MRSSLWNRSTPLDLWCTKAAEDFLTEYGGLHIKYPHAKVANMEDVMHFDPLIVITHITPAAVSAYAKVLDRKLCPIGEAARGYLTLMMDDTGKVYGSYDDFCVLVGSSGAEAIEGLCSGRDLEIIPLGDDW